MNCNQIIAREYAMQNIILDIDIKVTEFIENHNIDMSKKEQLKDTIIKLVKTTGANYSDIMCDWSRAIYLGNNFKCQL